MKTKTLLKDFTRYIHDHPEERFWQALRNWSGENFICVSNTNPDMFETEDDTEVYLEDTFYFEGKNK